MKHYLLFVFFILKCTPILFAQNFVKVDIAAPESVSAGSEFTLNLEVNKTNITDFAKLELYLPVGFYPKIIDAAGSTAIVYGQLLKFIWIELPEKTKFNLSIKISVDYRIGGYKEIFGNFYYVYNKQRKKNPIAVVPLIVINENKLQKTELISDVKSVKNVIPEKISNQKIVYRVQITANRKRINKEVLQELYVDYSAIKEELIDGLYKYTVGDFPTKENADVFRINCGVTGAFILSYENGVRIQK